MAAATDQEVNISEFKTLPIDTNALFFVNQSSLAKSKRLCSIFPPVFLNRYRVHVCNFHGNGNLAVIIVFF